MSCSTPVPIENPVQELEKMFPWAMEYRIEYRNRYTIDFHYKVNERGVHRGYGCSICNGKQTWFFSDFTVRDDDEIAFKEELSMVFACMYDKLIRHGNNAQNSTSH